MSGQKQPRQSDTASRKGEAAKELRDNIRRLMNGFRGWVEGAMRPQGMTVPQLRLLFAVHKDPQGSSASIARQCMVTPQTLQAMMQRAVREGWLVRRPAEHNARILTAALTPKGQTLLDSALEAFGEFELEIWRDASTADLQAVNAMLGKALQRLERAESAPAAAPTAVRRSQKPKSTASR